MDPSNASSTMRKLRFLVVGLAGIAAVAVAAEPVAAQFGNTVSGQTTSRSGLSTTGTFGNTQRGGVANRQQSSFARGTSTGANSFSGQSNPLANLGNAGSMLSNRNQQQGAFVGRSAEDMQRFIGAAAAQQQGLGQGRNQGMNFGGQQFGMGQQGRGQQGRGQGQFGQNGQFGDLVDNQAADQLQAQRRFRTKLALGFTPPPRLVSTVTTSTTIRLTKSLQRSVGPAVDVQLADSVVVLTGTVPTTAEKMLAEQLALLEPGVARVQNELVVADGTSPAN